MGFGSGGFISSCSSVRLLPLGFIDLTSTADTISPPSFSDFAAVPSTDGTGAAVGFTKLYLYKDLVCVMAASGVEKINFQYFNEDFGLDGGTVNYTCVNVGTVFDNGPALDERRRYSAQGASTAFNGILPGPGICFRYSMVPEIHANAGDVAFDSWREAEVDTTVYLTAMDPGVRICKYNVRALTNGVSAINVT